MHKGKRTDSGSKPPIKSNRREERDADHKKIKIIQLNLNPFSVNQRSRFESTSAVNFADCRGSASRRQLHADVLLERATAKHTET